MGSAAPTSSRLSTAATCCYELAGPYSVILAPSEPPTFVAVGETDRIAPPELVERRVAALRRAGTDVAYHRFPGVGHGFGLSTGTSADGWIANAIRFWAKHIDQRAQFDVGRE